jgi:hypothetical protein
LSNIYVSADDLKIGSIYYRQWVAKVIDAVMVSHDEDNKDMIDNGLHH